MATSTIQDQKFISAIISSTLLEEAINWISSNLSPEEVFSEGELEDWANRNGMSYPEG